MYLGMLGIHIYKFSSIYEQFNIYFFEVEKLEPHVCL